MWRDPRLLGEVGDLCTSLCGEIPDFLEDTAGEWRVRPLTPSSSGNKKSFTWVIPLVKPEEEEPIEGIAPLSRVK
jgi:hypothetical protein